MKLYYSATSPYARKVRVLIIEHGLQEAVELVRADPMAENAASKIGNPLSKVPALEMDDGAHLFDSPVICEYLDHQAAGEPLLAREGASRWAVLTAQALGDGILDAALSLVMESRRPETERSAYWQDRWTAAIHRGVDQIAEDVASDREAFDLGRIAYACALGYLDFRLPDLDWRGPHPNLLAWFEDMSARESFVQIESHLGYVGIETCLLVRTDGGIIAAIDGQPYLGEVAHAGPVEQIVRQDTVQSLAAMIRVHEHESQKGVIVRGNVGF